MIAHFGKKNLLNLAHHLTLLSVQRESAIGWSSARDVLCAPRTALYSTRLPMNFPYLQCVCTCFLPIFSETFINYVAVPTGPSPAPGEMVGPRNHFSKLTSSSRARHGGSIFGAMAGGTLHNSPLLNAHTVSSHATPNHGDSWSDTSAPHHLIYSGFNQAFMVRSFFAPGNVHLELLSTACHVTL